METEELVSHPEHMWYNDPEQLCSRCEESQANGYDDNGDPIHYYIA